MMIMVIQLSLFFECGENYNLIYSSAKDPIIYSNSSISTIKKCNSCIYLSIHSRMATDDVTYKSVMYNDVCWLMPYLVVWSYGHYITTTYRFTTKKNKKSMHINICMYILYV